METNQKKNKKLLIIIGTIVILCVLAVTIIVATVSGSGKKLSEQLDLGEKYLSELDYESAIAAYEVAIKIDPKAEDAYLGLAEVYVAMGEPDKALEVLQTGYEETGSDVIQEREEEIRQEQENGNTTEESSEGDRAGETVAEGTEEIAEPEQEETGVVFVPWDEAGLEDHVMDWQDENLEAAMRDVTGITDRDIMLSDVWEMTELILRDWDIKNIDALGELVNLTYLGIDSNWELEDISALGGLTNLTGLGLHFNGGIKDFSVIGSLTNLKGLDLGETWVDESDLGVLGQLTKLKGLNLDYNEIYDISILSSLSSLETLYLDGNYVNDISPLSTLTNLKTLTLNGNEISDVSALSELTNLTELDLSYNAISDISALSGLTNLDMLNLQANPIEDYSRYPLYRRCITINIYLEGN